MIGISEMFAELDGRQRYLDALDRWAVNRGEYMVAYHQAPERRRDAVERTRQWRKNNPDRARELGRRMWQQWKVKNPTAYKAKVKRASKAYKERYPEKVRARDRRNQRARRERLKAAASGVAA